MITFADFDALAVEVAECLTGQEIALRWRSPASIGSIGAASKLFDKFVIEVNPELPADQWLSVFLHECAHVLLHGKEMRDSFASIRPSASRTRKLVENPEYYAEELEADQLAEYWLNLAQEAAVIKTEYRMLEALRQIYSN